MKIKSFVHRIFAFVLCVLSFSLGTHAQNISEIKNSGKYYWGEGKGITTEEAEQAATTQLSRSISVTVYGETSDAEVNGRVSQKDIAQSFTSARLHNLERRVLKDEPDAHVLCFVLKSEVQKVMKERENRIRDMVQAGKDAEGRLQIDDALRCYYWAQMLSRFSPNTKISFGNQEGLASNLLPIKIKSVLQAMNADVMEGEQEGNRFKARLRFTYNGKNVSTVQFSYNDGQAMVGPVKAKDGLAEIELVSLDGNGKIHVKYETRFKEEVDPLDADLRSLYSQGRFPPYNSSTEIPVKLKSGMLRAGKPEKRLNETAGVAIAPQPTHMKAPIAMRNVQNEGALDAVLNVESAIKAGKPEIARQRFTSDGYRMFHTLLTETGNVSLVGNSEYQFIQADGYLVGRSTRIKIKCKGGKSFMENLVYRFDPQSGKICSVAFALTKMAENDIMNAAAQWPEVSRWTILNFMEDYQTAFALKRLDYISSIFSDDALIITGAMLKKAPASDQLFDQNKVIKFNSGKQNVQYSRHTKEEYIKRLGEIFKNRDFVHLTFENNVTKLIDMPSVVRDGAAFGIEIKQRYTSSTYSDEGYLTLFLDTRGKSPIIHVRLWQPDKYDMMSLQEFISKFSN